MLSGWKIQASHHKADALTTFRVYVAAGKFSMHRLDVSSTFASTLMKMCLQFRVQLAVVSYETLKALWRQLYAVNAPEISHLWTSFILLQQARGLQVK